MKVTKKYPYFYSPQDFQEMKPAVEDVFYESRGRTYTQFTKGVLLPLEIWNELFGSSKDGKKVESVDTKTTEVSQDEKYSEKESNKDLENVSEQPKESLRTRKKRRKSILKK